MKILSLIFNRIIILLLVLSGLSYVLTDQKMFDRAYFIRTLNGSIPYRWDYNVHFRHLEQHDPDKDHNSLHKMKLYFRNVTNLYPQMNQAWGLLGNAYYTLGEFDLTILRFV